MTRSDPRLARWIGPLWSSEPSASPPGDLRPTRTERLLPAGQCRLIVRLHDEPLWVAGRSDQPFAAVPQAALVGAHDRAVIRRSGALSASVGVLLKPGATLALFGLPAAAIAGQYVDLRDLCGSDADRLIEQVRDGRSAAPRIATLKVWLASRLDPARVGLPGGWPGRLERLLLTPADDEDGLPRVRAVATRLDWSQKRLVACWRDLAGLAPKQQQRVARFNHLLRLAGEPGSSWAELAVACGYSDQAHLGREFSDLAGLTPGQWRARHPRHPFHVPEVG